ncbi:MAG: hypothetical protein K2J68_03150, partial [Treponemataceae bacterium]|nr:hypothetical protein [Treponemataceae bacterium]
YILCYTKNSEDSIPFSIDTTTDGKKFPLNNAGNTLATLKFPVGSVKFSMPDGTISPQDMSEGNIITELLNPLMIKDGRNENEFQLRGEWRYSQERLNEIIRNGEELVISKIPFRPNHIKAGGEIKKMKNFLTTTHYQMETNEDATQQVIDLFGKDLFDNPKPVKLIKSFVKSITYDNPSAIVLDFFSGSATTAHAVMQLNAEDGGKRKFIMVQLPEPCDEKSEAYKAGYKNICEIGKERIRRAGAKIKQENGLTAQNLDTGFRVLKLDSSNMKDVYYRPEEYSQSMLEGLADNIKPDRTALDLLFQVMLDLGKPLSAKIEEREIAGKSVFNVDDGDLIACFEDNISAEIVTEIAKARPLYAVFRDSGLSSDSVAANFEQIFATYSPNTARKVL